jgi:hypothetical protein
MPLVPLDKALVRMSLLVCDGCDGVLTHEGGTTSKPHRESDPDDLSAHYDEPYVLRQAARSSGWTATGSEWRCGRCSAPAEAT